MAAFGEAYVVDPFGNQQASVAVDLIDPATGARIADTVYRDAGLTQVATLPLTTDSSGHAPFWLAAGKTVIGRVVLGGSTYDDYINVVDPTAPVSGGGSVPTHTHVEGDVNNLTIDLSAKAPISHTHTEAQVTNLATDLTAKAATIHSHAEADVGNLLADLGATEKTANKNIANGYAGLDNAGHILTAQLPGSAVSRVRRPFEDFGGKLSTDSPAPTLSSQTAAYALARAASDAAGGITITFGGGIYPHMPQMEMGSYMTLEGAGMFATVLQFDSSITSGACIYNHVSTNGTTDPNATACSIQSMWLDCGQLPGNGTNPVDAIFFSRNPQFGNGAAADPMRVYNSAYNDMWHYIHDVNITKPPRDGVVSAGMGGQYWENIYVSQAGRYGFQPPFDSATVGCTSAYSGAEGFLITGSPCRLDACKAYSSGNIVANRAIGHGYHIQNIALGSVTLTNCEAQDNFAIGYFVDNCSKGQIAIVGCWADDNSVRGAGLDPGFKISASPNTQLRGCRSSDRGIVGHASQLHALSVLSTSTGCSIELKHIGQNGWTVGTPIDTWDANCTGAEVSINSSNGLQSVAFAATVTPDFWLGGIVKIGALTANITIGAPANGPFAVGQRATIILVQDATGGRTITWNGAYVNTPTTNAGASAYTIGRFIFDGTSWIGA